MTRALHNAQPRPADGYASLRASGRKQSQRTGDDWEQTTRQAIAGDSGAERRLLLSVAPRVRALCRGVLGREHPEIEDAVQESLLDLLRALPRFRFEADISHYAVRIALRRAISIRALHRENTARFPLYSASPDAKVATQADCRASVRRTLVRALLMELPQPQAEAIALRVMLEYSIQEVGSITGVSPNTVKTRLSLARRTLKRRIACNPRYRAAFEEALDD